MWLVLNKYKYALYFVLLMLLIGASWQSGYKVAKNQYQAQMASLKAEYAQQATDRAQQSQNALQAALNEQQKWQALAQKQGVELAKITQQLDRQAAQYQKEIQNVIQKDNSGSTHYNGIGNDSLHIYNRAFGYHD